MVFLITLHTESMKCDGGPTELSRSGHRQRVISIPTSLEILLVMGDAGNSLVCVSSEQEAPDVLFSSSRSNGLVGRCVPSFLGQSGCVRLFPIHPDQHGHQLISDLLMPQNDSDCSMLVTP